MLQRALLTTFSFLLLLFSTACILIGVEKKGGAPSTHVSVGSTVPVVPFTKATSLVVVWSNGDRDVALNICLSYVNNAAKNKWFDNIALIVWGPSAKLLANDEELQSKIELIIAGGVRVVADAESAGAYGATDKLKGLGIEVKPMDKPITDLLKAAGTRVLTF
jgi:hypothetical protein